MRVRNLRKLVNRLHGMKERIYNLLSCKTSLSLPHFNACFLSLALSLFRQSHLTQPRLALNSLWSSSWAQIWHLSVCISTVLGIHACITMLGLTDLALTLNKLCWFLLYIGPFHHHLGFSLCVTFLRVFLLDTLL